MFQSLNREKPLCYVKGYQNSRSKEQFQSLNREKPLCYATRIAFQSFERSSFNRSIAKNLFATSPRLLIAPAPEYSFNRSIAKNLFATGKIFVPAFHL